MRNVALGSVVTLILFTGLFVSQVEAKNHDNDDKDKNKHVKSILYRPMSYRVSSSITTREAFPFPGPYWHWVEGLSAW